MIPFGLLYYKNLRDLCLQFCLTDTVKSLGTYFYAVHKMYSLNVSQNKYLNMALLK